MTAASTAMTTKGASGRLFRFRFCSVQLSNKVLDAATFAYGKTTRRLGMSLTEGLTNEDS